MHTNARAATARSPVPAVMPEPTTVQRESDAEPPRAIAAPPVGATAPAASLRRRGNVAGAAIAKLAGILRGAKYMVDAYPASDAGKGSPVPVEPGVGGPAATAARER